MKKLLVRMRAGVALALCLTVCLGGVSSRPALAGAADHGKRVRPQLVGTWRLISIQVIGPEGRRNDPFYDADVEGVLVYAPSGWMSVQIASKPRPSMETPASRSAGPHAPESAQVAAAVLDTYYAYVATWDYDDATSKVTHHVRQSLIPGETGKTYSQTVRLNGNQLTFTVPREDLGHATVQQKVWERIAGSAGQ